MLDRIHAAISRLKHSNSALYRIYCVIAVIMLISSLFAVLENSISPVKVVGDYFNSALFSNPQIICTPSQSNPEETVNLKRSQTFPNQVFSAYVKLSSYIQTLATNCHLGNILTYAADCQQMYFQIDLPPPSLL